MAFIAPSQTELAAPRKRPALRGKLEELLGKADIRINGPRPWDMQVHKPGVLERIASHGSLALGEYYMAGEWGRGAAR